MEDQPLDRATKSGFSGWASALAVLLGGALGSHAASDTHVVDASGLGDHRSIQDAIDASVSGDVILVRPGTYRPKMWNTTVATVPAHLSDLTIQSTVGAAGTVMHAAPQGWRMLSRGVRWDGPGGRLVGFTIQGGRERNGGGLYSASLDLEVRSCDFLSNQANANGGAVYLQASTVDSSFRPRLVDCQFSSNTAGADGGSVHADGGVDMESCIIHFSEAGGRGGAICITDDSFGSNLVDVVAGWCDARFGGCLALDAAHATWNGGSALFSAARHGGAVHADGGSILQASSWYAVGNDAAMFGGAVSLDHATADLENSVIAFNTARVGGAVDVWYAALASEDTDWYENESAVEGGAVSAYRSLIEGDRDVHESNRSDEGGAIWAYDSTVVVADGEFVMNDAAYGGVVYSEESRIEITGSVFSGNRADEEGGVFRFLESDADVASSEFESNGSTLGGVLFALEGSGGSSYFLDCTLQDNEALEGGAILSENFGDFEDVVFAANESQVGSHVHLQSSGSGSTFTGCSFIGGTLMDPSGLGSAIYTNGIIGSLDLHQCTATGNHAGYDGGVFRFENTSSSADISISSSRFESNTTEQDGGGFFLGDGGQIHASGSAVRIEDSYIEGVGGRGGAVYGRFDIARSTITGAAGDSGGAAWLLSSSSVTSSVLIGSTDGALSAVYDDSGWFVDCVVMANRAENTSASPGAAATTTGAEVFDATDCFFFANGLDDIALISGTDSGNRLSDDAGCRADFDRDGDIDGDDSDHVLVLIGTVGWGLAEDLDDDGDIDADDHLSVVALEGTSCP